MHEILSMTQRNLFVAVLESVLHLVITMRSCDVIFDGVTTKMRIIHRRMNAVHKKS